MEDVGLEADAVAGGADGLELGGVEVGAVGEDLEAAGAVDDGVGEGFDEVEEGVGVVGRELIAAGDVVVRGWAEDAGERVTGDERERDDAKDGNPRGNGDDEEESADHESLKYRDAYRMGAYAMQS